ncbi:dipeptide ABC transporter ATP-binding protein [Devosia epidermidihirudinis]|uniref:dipeptide ABC transporter ATP-binding protein n=1 Tax=Devosia epidermidihirudinis TaxID=1293439 RepID=UPI000B306916|nr:ABC transporter ATP-binding protein [Devosia epidermidihirudinis]
MSAPLLSVRDLTVDYASVRRQGRAVDGVSFDIAPGEAVALVGESGCGKSTTALALLRLLPDSTRIGGSIVFDGQNINGLDEKALRQLRGRRIGMVFQEPMTSLNPVQRIGHQIAEVLRVHTNLGSCARRARVLELLHQVAIPDPTRNIRAFPHELSGGQRQRVVIAMAIAMNPDLLIADEPTTALDSAIQAQILELLDRLRRELGMALLLISHDLPLVEQWSDRVIVVHHGQVMEELPSQQLFAQSQHAYTRGLINASVRLHDDLHYTNGRLVEVAANVDPSGDHSFTLTRPPLPASAPALTPSPCDTSLLSVSNISVQYGERRVVDDLSLRLGRGETLGLVGESGCGKSTLSRTIVGLLRPSAGSIRLNGQDILNSDAAARRALRRRVQMVFQDPYASLNPRHRIGELLGNILAFHGERDPIQRQGEVFKVLDQVGLPRSAAYRWPHEFSGGQRQRIGIARALILQPELILLDEPVSALDVSVQAQILNLLADLKATHGLSYIFISHDLAIVRYFSDRVAVMHAGRIVEENDARTLLLAPTHAQTRRLIEAAH